MWETISTVCRDEADSPIGKSKEQKEVIEYGLLRLSKRDARRWWLKTEHQRSRGNEHRRSSPVNELDEVVVCE